MFHVHDVIDYLAQLAPLALAEKWDNVGLLVGDSSQPVQRVMTCLTLTPDVAREAVERNVQLVVTHHPVLFRPVQRVTADDAEGRLLLELIGANISVYSPHTSYDSAAEGINRQLAERLGLTDITPLRPLTEHEVIATTSGSYDVAGGGRGGTLPRPTKLSELLMLVKLRLGVSQLQFTGRDEQVIHRLGVACGSAAEFIRDAIRHDCQALLLGEARFHALLEAESAGLSLILVGHYASERPAVERLAEMIRAAFASLEVWPSDTEHDPMRWA